MGTGYTRNDTTNNIADGNVINAADLDGEFDAIVTALSTGGHTHDGTAAEGGPVTVVGPAQDVVVSANNVIPKADNTLDLGTSTLEFKDLFLDGTAHIDTLDVDENANIDGNLAIGGNLVVTGTTTFNGGTITLGDAATDNVVFAADVDSSIIPDDDDTYDLGSSSQQWRDIYIDGSAYIDGLAEDILVATDKKVQFRDTGLLINSSTDGQLDIDADVELEITAPTVDINASTAVLISNDLKLDSDAAVLSFGVDSEITVTHVADTGLTLTHTGTGDNTPIVLQLKSEEDAVLANEVLGSIEFAAGDDSGTDAATVAAGIHAIAEAEFTSSANATKLVFTTGVSETAAASATAKMILSSAGLLTIADDFMLKDGGTIGVASTNDAITIASTGIVTFKDDILIKDAGTIGSASDPDAIAISSGGVIAISATTAASSSTSGALTVAGGAGIAADLHVGDDLVVTGDATFNGDTHTFASANSTDPVLIIKNTTNDTNGSRLHFVKDKGAAGADGDDIGIIEFISDDADQAQTSFAKIVAEVSESLGGDEAGKLSFFVAESDSTNTALTAGLVIEGEHATDGEVDVTIAAGTASTTTVAGDLVVTTDATVGGTLGVTGVLTTTAGITSGSNIVSDTDSTDDLGTTSVRWANLFVDGITATDQITATGFTGTLDGILGSGAAATASVTTLDTSGAVNLNLATDSTSSTSGALIVDGGVGVAKKLFVGTDLDVDGTTNLDAVDIDGAVDMATTLAVAGNVDFNGDLDVDGTTNLDVVDIDGAVDMASTLNIGGTTNDGTTLTQITQSGTGRGLAINRNVASATRAMVGLAQLSGSGGTQAVLDVQQAVSSSRAIKVTADGSTDRFSVYGTGALVTTPPAGGHAVFNEGGVDVDFRVKSNGNAHMLFVDGGNDTVAIGTDDTNFDPVADNLIVGTGGGSNGITIYTGSSAGSKGSIFFADTAAGDAANSRKGQISYEQNNEIMTFFTNNSLALTLALNGSATIANGLTLTDGDLVVANTHGINFAATGDGAGTDTSETLHDYEEGTFTPLLSNAKPSGGSVTFSSQIGVYTKIGNVVSFSLSVLANGSTIESSSNEVLVVGLPYDVKNISSQHFPPASLFCDSGFNQSAATQGYIPVLINGTAGIKIFGILSAATSNQNVLRYNELGRGNTTTSFAFRIAGTYRTA